MINESPINDEELEEYYVEDSESEFYNLDGID
jgi:hypothetical protein